MLGRDAASNPDYGLADDTASRLFHDLANLADAIGTGAAATALRISPRRLRAIRAGKAEIDDRAMLALSVRLPTALIDADKVRAGRASELHKLTQLVESLGYRGAARQLGMDPSNLRRKIARLAKSTRSRQRE